MPKTLPITEKTIHSQVCDYIKLQYPDIIFTSDASGMRTTIGLRVELKRKRCVKYKIPDLLILHPANGKYGLFIEVKKNITDVFLKGGGIKADTHVQEQARTICRLQVLGYSAFFGCGFEHCKRIIDNYLKK